MARSPRLAAVLIAAALTLAACSLPARDDDAADDSPVQQVLLSGSAARYLMVAETANVTIDKAFDGLEDAQADGDLAAARRDFALAAKTERSFDRDLLGLPLPAPAKATARALVDINEQRAALTEKASQSTSLADVDRFAQDIDRLTTAVEDQVNLIRRQLGLPPPDAS